MFAFVVSLLVACTEAPPPEPEKPKAEVEAAKPPPPPPEAPAPAAARVNLNTATEAELAALPGVGPKMVKELLEYRPYASVLKLRKEIGKYVPPEEITRLETLVFVPIDPQASDAPTLLQIPGLEQAEVEAVLAGRPYADKPAFMGAIAPLITPADLEVARGMVVVP